MNNKHITDAQKTWDLIAESFDKTRKKPWRQCLDFIDAFKDDFIVGDFGCGNGRHLIPLSQKCKKVIGIDISIKLIEIVQKNIKEKKISNVCLLHSDLTNIPMKNNLFDAVLCIATLHNIKGRDKRIKSLKEIKRVLKDDGYAMITVWSRWQDRFILKFLKRYFKFSNTSEFGDIEIYWRQNKLNVPRFYHLYSKREFTKDIKNAKLNIVDMQDVNLFSNFCSDNFFAIVKK